MNVAISIFLFILALQGSPDPQLESWMGLLEASQTRRLEEQIGEQPEQAVAACQKLLKQFDTSVHSWRDRPEQRRVRYSDDLLDMGIRFAGAIERVTSVDSLLQRFLARQDRMEATRLLNDKQHRQAIEKIEVARRRIEDVSDPRFLFSTYLTTAYAHLEMGAPDRALDDCQRALQLARQIGEQRQIALALYNLGAAQLHLGDIPASRPYSSQAAEAAKGIGNAIWEANARLNVGTADYSAGHFESAEEQFRLALELSRQADDPLGEGRALYNLGLLYQRLQRWQPAVDHLQQSLRFVREVDIRHSHEITEYNHVEVNVLEALLSCYESMQIEDSALILPLQQRLEEIRQTSQPVSHHHH